MHVPQRTNNRYRHYACCLIWFKYYVFPYIHDQILLETKQFLFICILIKKVLNILSVPMIVGLELLKSTAKIVCFILILHHHYVFNYTFRKAKVAGERRPHPGKRTRQKVCPRGLTPRSPPRSTLRRRPRTDANLR